MALRRLGVRRYQAARGGTGHEELHAHFGAAVELAGQVAEPESLPHAVDIQVERLRL
jgi:hypothetical protein